MRFTLQFFVVPDRVTMEMDRSTVRSQTWRPTDTAECNDNLRNPKKKKCTFRSISRSKRRNSRILGLKCRKLFDNCATSTGGVCV